MPVCNWMNDALIVIAWVEIRNIGPMGLNLHSAKAELT